MFVRKILAGFCAVAVLALSACAAPPDDTVQVANADHAKSQTSATSTSSAEPTETSETASPTAKTSTTETTSEASDTPDLTKASAYCKATVDPKKFDWDEYRLVADGTSDVFFPQFDTNAKRPIKVQTPTYQHWVDRASNGKLRVDGMWEDGNSALQWPIEAQITALYDDWNRIVHDDRTGTRKVPSC